MISSTPIALTLLLLEGASAVPTSYLSPKAKSNLIQSHGYECPPASIDFDMTTSCEDCGDGAFLANVTIDAYVAESLGLEPEKVGMKAHVCTSCTLKKTFSQEKGKRINWANLCNVLPMVDDDEPSDVEGMRKHCFRKRSLVTQCDDGYVCPKPTVDLDMKMGPKSCKYAYFPGIVVDYDLASFAGLSTSAVGKMANVCTACNLKEGLSVPVGKQLKWNNLCEVAEGVGAAETACFRKRCDGKCAAVPVPSPVL